MRVLINVGVVAGSLLGLFLVARIVRAFAGRWVRRVPNISRLLQSFIVFLIYWLTIAVGLMIVLSALGINVTPAIALLGGASFILAFALQDTLGNLAAGLMIMVNRPFDEGDAVDISGVAGTVKAVSVVSTTVMTPDNQVIVVPNSKVWGNVIKNATASDTRRIDMTFGVSNKEPIERVQTLLAETVRSHPLVLAAPAPVVEMSEFTDSAMKFVVRPWTRSGDYGTVHADLLRKVKERLDAEGIAHA